MYRAARTSALPAKIVRLPRYLPLSRLMGASPARAAIFFLFNCPSSGSRARRVQALTGPIPLKVLRRFSFSLHRGVFLIRLLMSFPTLLIHWASHAMWTSISAFVQEEALWRRFFSSVSIWTSCLLLATRACNLWASASFKGRTSGLITSPNRAITSASMASVFASLPVAFAKSRTCFGLMTTTLSLWSARISTTGTSYPPEAYNTTRSGPSFPRNRARSVRPFSSLEKSFWMVSGRMKTTSVSFATSIPAYRSIITPPCVMRALRKARVAVRAYLEKDVTIHALARDRSPQRGVGLSRPDTSWDKYTYGMVWGKAYI